MQKLLYLEILACASDQGFSLDELVYKTQALFEEQGMAGMVALILSLLDDQLCREMCGRGSGRETVWKPHACCASPRYELHDHRKRRFRTSVGTVRITWRRVRCQYCGKTFIPLQEFLGLNPRQAKTSELERMVMEVISEQSYRRTGNHLNLIGKIPVPKSTLHRWVALSDSDQLNWDKPTPILMADGTGYKRRPDPARGLDNQGELRIALGIRWNGQLMPLGAFSGIGWDEIAGRLNRMRKSRRQRLKLLVSDGESGIAAGLAFMANQHQRCHWHLLRDLKFNLRHDHAAKPETDQNAQHLAAILGIELQPDAVETVLDQDRKTLRDKIQRAEAELDALELSFHHRGYRRAAQCLASAKKKLFNHLRFWLRYGILPPRTTSIIERIMREIGRRLKRIAFGWSETGAAKMARIIIKKVASPQQWKEFWLKKMRIEGRVILRFRGAHAK